MNQAPLNWSRFRQGLTQILAVTLAALTAPTFAEAQPGLRSTTGLSSLEEGELAANPVRRSERALANECGPTRLENGDIQRDDFTGDGQDDYIIRIAASCRGVAGYFCGSRGCRTDLWVREGDGYRLEATLIAHSAEIVSRRDGPVVMFDRGPVWRWNGRELALEARSGESGSGSAAATWRDDDRDRANAFDRDRIRDRDFDRDPDSDGFRENVRDDGPSADHVGAAPRPAVANPPAPEKAPQPDRGVWRVETDIDGVPNAVIEELRSDGHMSLGCGPTNDTYELSLWPSRENEADVAGAEGSQHLVEFVVDGRSVQARMLIRRFGDDGPLSEPAIIQDDALIRALKKGSRLLLRNLGDGKPLAILRLSGSRDSIDELAYACSQ